MRMLKAFQQLSQSHQQSNNQQQPQGIQLVLGQQQAQPQDDMFKKMMMKMMMKKLFFNQQEDHHEQNEYKMDLTSPFGNIGNQRSNNKYEMMEQMMKTFMNQKHKRAADDVFELGDRLTEKLKQETVKMQAKLGNASCVLQELGIIDQNQNLDINAMVKSVEDGEWGAFQTNGSKSTTSRTAALVPPTPILSQKPFLTNVPMARSGAELCFSSNVRRKPSTSVA